MVFHNCLCNSDCKRCTGFPRMRDICKSGHLHDRKSDTLPYHHLSCFTGSTPCASLFLSEKVTGKRQLLTMTRGCLAQTTGKLLKKAHRSCSGNRKQCGKRVDTTARITEEGPGLPLPRSRSLHRHKSCRVIYRNAGNSPAGKYSFYRRGAVSAFSACSRRGQAAFSLF